MFNLEGHSGSVPGSQTLGHFLLLREPGSWWHGGSSRSPSPEEKKMEHRGQPPLWVSHTHSLTLTSWQSQEHYRYLPDIGDCIHVTHLFYHYTVYMLLHIVLYIYDYFSIYYFLIKTKEKQNFYLSIFITFTFHCILVCMWEINSWILNPEVKGIGGRRTWGGS